jgi:hypothetical protein
MAERRWIDRTRERVTANPLGTAIAVLLVVAVVGWMIFSIGRTPSGIPS